MILIDKYYFLKLNPIYTFLCYRNIILQYLSIFIFDSAVLIFIDIETVRPHLLFFKQKSHIRLNLDTEGGGSKTHFHQQPITPLKYGRLKHGPWSRLKEIKSGFVSRFFILFQIFQKVNVSTEYLQTFYKIGQSQQAEED